MQYRVTVYRIEGKRRVKSGTLVAKDQAQATALELALFNTSDIQTEIEVRLYIGRKPIDINAYELPSFMDDMHQLTVDYYNSNPKNKR